MQKEIGAKDEKISQLTNELVSANTHIESLKSELASKKHELDE